MLALQYVLQEERIASTFVGMCTVQEVDTNLRALQEPLDRSLLAEVQEMLAPVKDLEWPSGNWPRWTGHWTLIASAGTNLNRFRRMNFGRDSMPVKSFCSIASTAS